MWHTLSFTFLVGILLSPTLRTFKAGPVKKATLYDKKRINVTCSIQWQCFMKMPLLTLGVLRKSVKFWDGGYHQNLLMFWYTFFSAKGSTPPIQRKIGPKNISLLNAESYLGIFANLQDFFEGFKIREAIKAKKSQNCGLCPYLP